MLRLRREELEPRIELMPLIDVIFLILTFFIYAMVLMVRVDMLPVPLETYASSEEPDTTPAVGITLRLDGSIYVGHDQVPLNDVLPTIEKVLNDEPGTVVYLVMEAGNGTVDRGPLLTGLWDHLHLAGIDIQLVGQDREALEPAP
ncbi:MAG: biopolymer transporter ExbD [Planctomycetota bacterium]|nr:biopolymer transporter ExbD [Planctomycetota bacterium]